MQTPCDFCPSKGEFLGWIIFLVALWRLALILLLIIVQCGLLMVSWLLPRKTCLPSPKFKSSLHDLFVLGSFCHATRRCFWHWWLHQQRGRISKPRIELTIIGWHQLCFFKCVCVCAWMPRNITICLSLSLSLFLSVMLSAMLEAVKFPACTAAKH